MFLVNKLNDQMVIVNLDTQISLSVVDGRIKVKPMGITICSGTNEELNERLADIVSALKANARVYDFQEAIGVWKPSKAKSTETAAQTKARKAKGPAMRGGPAAETK